MIPKEYGAWLASPARSAVKGSILGGSLGAGAGLYRYMTSEAPTWKDVAAPAAAGAGLGGLFAAAGQTSLNAPVHAAFSTGMTDWEATRGREIFDDALRSANLVNSSTPWRDAVDQVALRRRVRQAHLADNLKDVYGDRDIFKLRTHRGR